MATLEDVRWVVDGDDLHAKLAKPEPGLEELVAERHHELESACQGLVSHALTDDPHALAARWDALDAVLREHMAAEEDLIIPAWQITAPEEGVELRNQHARIRELLDQIAIDVQHHTIDALRVRGLAELLRVHAEREDKTMYPWAERNLPLVARRQLVVRIRRWLHRLASR